MFSFFPQKQIYISALLILLNRMNLLASCFTSYTDVKRVAISLDDGNHHPRCGLISLFWSGASDELFGIAHGGSMGGLYIYRSMNGWFLYMGKSGKYTIPMDSMGCEVFWCHDESIFKIFARSETWFVYQLFCFCRGCFGVLLCCSQMFDTYLFRQS